MAGSLEGLEAFLSGRTAHNLTLMHAHQRGGATNWFFFSLLLYHFFTKTGFVAPPEVFTGQSAFFSSFFSSFTFPFHVSDSQHLARGVTLAFKRARAG